MRILRSIASSLVCCLVACGGSSDTPPGESAAGGGGGAGGESAGAAGLSGSSGQSGAAGSGAAGSGGSGGSGGSEASGSGGSGEAGTSSGVCIPGQQFECGCIGTTSKGVQTCLPDASGLGPCAGCPDGAGGAAGAAGGTAGAAGEGGGGASGEGGGGAGSGGSGPVFVGTCKDARPDGAPAAAAPPGYSAGVCPQLVPGPNVIKTSGDDRTFLLVVPSDHDGKEPLPLIFLWHWLGGSANSFLEKGEVQKAADQLRFAAVIPEAKKDQLNTFKWPYSIIAQPAQVENELRFFDDMLSCVSEQYPIQSDCVASMGVSAGALWTDQLAGFRSQYLSSIVSLSGGVGGPLIKPWNEAQHKMPAYVLWGGPGDVCVTVQFEQTSKNLQQELTSGGHFQVECIHNCKHAEPPLDPVDGFSKYTPVWRFFLEHPYWLSPGASPWNQSGLPAGSPSWCGIGVGSATPRTGECPEPPSCPI